VYGYPVDPTGIDPLVKVIEQMMLNFSAAVVPLYWPADIIPALKYFPEWFPGCSSLRTARKMKEINEAVTDIPYTLVRQQMAQGIHKPSYVSRHVDENTKGKQQLSVDDENTIKSTAANLYAAGSDTTASSLTSFVLAIMKFPHVQRKAQEEIDNLTGSLRLPGFEDRKNLPYVDAVVKETLRWFPVTPMGMAHIVDEDVPIKDYLIPKGAILLPAVRWFLHDPQVYADPESFDPSRFLPPRNEPDPTEAAFGFGRRICAGRFLADSSLFITIAQLLATFNISKALDDEGREIEPQIRSVAGVVDHPVDFPYHIAPRSPQHVSLVEKNSLEYPYEKDAGSVLPSAQYRYLGSLV
jgi:cytochrome P450